MVFKTEGRGVGERRYQEGLVVLPQRYGFLSAAPRGGGNYQPSRLNDTFTLRRKGKLEYKQVLKFKFSCNSGLKKIIVNLKKKKQINGI